MKRFNWLLTGLMILCLAMVLLAGCVPKSEYEALQAEHATLMQENTSLKGKLAEAQSDLTNAQADYEAASKELAEIKQVYPLKYFPDANALAKWLSTQPEYPEASDTILWYQHALELQKAAARDGYIISAFLLDRAASGKYEVFCYAVLEDNSLYWWDPDVAEIRYWLDVNSF